MKTDVRTRYVREINTAGEEVTLGQPFNVEREKQRRFIRLDILAPMSMQKIKDQNSGFWPQGDTHVIEGIILNISAGGVLVDLQEAVSEGDVVSMRFTLQEVESLDYILGLIKRVEKQDDAFLAGIEFISKQYLQDLFTAGELDTLPEKYVQFDEGVRGVLNRYVRDSRTGEEQR